jgi:hypothetical protein
MAGKAVSTFGRVALGAVGFGLGSMVGMPALGAAAAMSLGSWLFPPKYETNVRQIKSVVGTSSVEGVPVPIIYGKVRVGGVILWTDKIKHHIEYTEVDSGKGGGSQTVSSREWYTISFAVALGEGELELLTIYEGKRKVNKSNTFYSGSPTQNPDSWLSGKTGKSIGYRNTSYIIFRNYNVGTYAAIPQLTFAVRGGVKKFNVTMNVVHDGNDYKVTKNQYITIYNSADPAITPAYAINDLIVNDRYGAGFGKEVRWWDADYDCQQNSYLLNMAITERRSLSSLIEILSAHGWLMTIYSGTYIKLLLAKNTVPAKTIELDHLLGVKGEQIIDVFESGKSDRFNRLTVEYTDVSKEYSPRPIQVEDIADQQAQGIKKNTVSLLGFNDADVTKEVGFKMLRNSLYARRIVNFSLGPEFLDLEAGDLVYVNASTVGLSQMRTRIIGIDETEEFNLTVTAREEPTYIYDSVNYTVPANLSLPVPAASAGLSQALGFQMLEVPKELQTTTGNVEMLPVYGFQNEDTVGYNIYSSIDNITYTKVKNGLTPADYGIVADNVMGKDSFLDTTDLAIDIEPSYGASFSTISRFNMMAGKNLGLIGDELIFFQTATLGTTYDYVLDNLARNRYNTLPKSHAIGEPLFCLNDLERTNVLKSKIGSYYYYKAVPVNIANEEGEISDVTAVGLTIEGWAYRPYRPGSVWLEENGVSTRGRERTNDVDLTIGWSLVDKYTGFGRKPSNIQAFGDYTQDEDHTSVEIDIVVGGSVVRTSNMGTSQTYTYLEADNIADNSGFANTVTFRVYSKSIYGRSKDYNEKTITSV